MSIGATKKDGERLAKAAAEQKRKFEENARFKAACREAGELIRNAAMESAKTARARYLADPTIRNYRFFKAACGRL